jgi:O-antigen/teichoic acid export membrane protein
MRFMTWKALRKKTEKSIFWHITYANVLSLAFLLVNFFLLLFFDGLFEDYDGKYDYIQDLILAIPLATAFPFMLLRTAKKKYLVCDEELIDDYRKSNYISAKDDLKIVWKREWRYFLWITLINIATTILTNIDILIMGKPTVTGVFTLYVAMRILSLAFPFSKIFGLVMATLYVCALYLFLLLRYRKKRYLVLDHNFRLAKYADKTDYPNAPKTF